MDGAHAQLVQDSGKEENKPEGYLGILGEELKVFMEAPMSANDYVRADKVAQPLAKLRKRLNSAFTSLG